MKQDPIPTNRDQDNIYNVITPKISFFQIIKRFIKNHLYLLICALNFIFIDRIFRYLYHPEGLIEYIDIVPDLFSLAWCFILLAIILILPGKIKKAAIIILTVLYNMLILIHCGLFSFNGSFFSFSDIMFADDGAEFFHLEYIYIRHIIIATTVGSILISILSAVIAPANQQSKRLIIFLFATVFFVSGIVTIQAVEKHWFGDYVAVSWNSYQQYSDIYQSFNDPVSNMMLTGLYQYTFRDLWLTCGVDRWLNGEGKIVEEITEYNLSKKETPQNEMTGIFEGKNLILIQLEAIDTWMLTPEAMPNLYQLQKQSIQFTNHYAPLYLSGGTFNTEIMVNTGHFPPFYGGKTSVYTDNEYPISLANLFSEEGYTTRSFHNSGGEVYARGKVHPNWGYETYYSGTDINMEDIEFDSGLISGFQEMTEGNPFFSFIITYSGHGPYVNSKISAAHYQRFAQIYPDKDSTYIHAVAHAYETDLFIGELVSHLKSAELWEDTVLIFYSDHYNYYTLDDSLVMEYKNIDDANLIKNVPFFIYSADTEPLEVTKVTSSIDILPTIVNLFNFNVDTRFYAGYDGFSEDGGYVIFEDYSWLDETQYYQYGATSENKEISDRNSEISKRIQISNNVLLTDYFSKVEESIFR